MTLQEFIKKYTGKRLDWDGAYGAQCVDLYRYYVKEVWGKPQTPGVVGAYQIINTLPADYEKIYNSPTNFPQPGDVITWNQRQVKNGHVAVVVSANINTFDAFQQNAPLSDVNGKTGSPGNIQRYTYKNIIGWFRPKSAPTPQPEPTPMPTQYKKKVLILLSRVADATLTPFKNGVATYVNRVALRTNNDFSYDISYFVTDAQFHTEHGISTDNNPIVYVNPMEIAVEGHKAELAMSKEFDTVCLLYDPAFVIGDPPTNPVENPITVEGFNPIQIPTTWVGDQAGYWNSEYSARIFFAHEDSHSNYYIVNSEAGANQRDKTHDSNPYASVTPNEDLDVSEFFIDLLKELKPWWVYLTQGNASENNMTKYFRVDQAGKKGIMLLEGYSGSLIFEDKWDDYLRLLEITGMTLQTPEISIPIGRFFRINDHNKLGIMIVEGFSGSVLFENAWSDYQVLLQITAGTANAPVINIP